MMDGGEFVSFNLADLSRAVSHALRHEPWLYELELDDEGWASVESVLTALRGERAEWQELAEPDLVRMIAESSKRRHEINGGRVRALYGHSIPGKLNKIPAIPPAILYHGTSPDTVLCIRTSGLLPMARQYVHLSVDEAMAVEVGQRKAKEPVILQVQAAEAYASGVQFYAGNEKVWLADNVPVQFLRFDKLGSL
jgi:putative RNA 2'-phosphotransferase